MLPTGETTYMSRKVKPEVVWTTGLHSPDLSLPIASLT